MYFSIGLIILIIYQFVFLTVGEKRGREKEGEGEKERKKIMKMGIVYILSDISEMTYHHLYCMLFFLI